MGIFTSMDISVTGLEANRLRMEVAAANLANAESSAPDDASVFRVRRVNLTEAAPTRTTNFADLLIPAGVQSSVVALDRPPRLEMDPDHPDADAQGMVRYPQVNIVEEMAEMMAARRAYEAGVTAYAEARTMFLKTLELGA